MIYIPGEVRSGKNSKQWTGRHLVHSQAAQKYARNTAVYWKLYRAEFLKLIDGKEFPLKLIFTFVRSTRAKFDYVNMVQLPLDMMQKYGWLPDDDADHVIPIFRSYKYDKKNPGLIIDIE